MSDTQTTVLAIETATKACSVALLYNGKAYVRHEVVPQKHAHRVLPMVDEVLAEAGITGNQVDLLAFGEGPGAFTGIRIAAGVIQGLALGWDKPVVAISTLQALLQPLTLIGSENAKPDWVALLDARMGEIYQLSASYSLQQKQWVFGEVLLCSPEQVKQYIEAHSPLNGVGDIASEYPSVVGRLAHWEEALPRAEAIARLAVEKRHLAKSIETQIPVPLYLRNRVADTIEERKLKQAAKTEQLLK